MKPLVILEKCDNYKNIKNIEDIINNAFNFMGYKDNCFKKKKVLIKPNLLSKKGYEKHVTTHPAVLEAIIKNVIKRDGNVFIGDSPAGKIKDINEHWEAGGWLNLKEKYKNIKLVNFEKSELSKIYFNNLKELSYINVTKHITDADIIISAAKFKTHGFTGFTGALKNLYGVIPGLKKAEIHKLAFLPYDFSNILVELFLKIKPHIAIIDGIYAMEGLGPAAGTPKKMNTLIISNDCLAADIKATELMNISPFNILTNKIGLKKHPDFNNISEIILKGTDINSLIAKDFKIPGTYNILKRLPSNSKGFFKIITRVAKFFPYILKKECRLCNECYNACPVKAIKKYKKGLFVDKTKCIQCLCCHEICRFDAITIKKNISTKILQKFKDFLKYVLKKIGV